MRAIKLRVLVLLNILATVFIIVACFCAKISVCASDIEFSIFAKDKTYLLSGKELSYYNGRYYINCLEGVVDKIYIDTLTPPIDASIVFCPDKKEPFEFKNEVIGLGVDREKLLNDINSSLKINDFSVTATFIEIKPKITVESLKNYTNKRAEFSTQYQNSKQGRKQNIKLATSKISGTVLNKGEEFSFNNVVGKRTEENGFFSATVIENGEFAEGVGGGVCQVSTTLYNCALLSGLTITKRYAHSLVPNYIEPSFDAMVSGDFFDLAFENQTSGNVYIKGVADGNNLTFTIYGEKLNESYKRVSKILETISPPETEVIEDENLVVGQTEWVKIAKDGIKSQAFLIVESGGERARTIKLHTDSYKFVRGQVKIGKSSQNNSLGVKIDKGS